jgi:large subunit ribosomal protein L10
MSSIREGKAEVVEAVRTRLDEASGALVTEYRGLTVAEMATLRKSLRAAGGDYKVFKNTLVRRAVSGSDHAPLAELLEGPTAIAFVTGDVSAVAKALRDFAKGAPALVIKGGVLDGALLNARELGALADLPSREVLLSMFAGALAAPLRQMAGLLKAVPQNLAYGLAALVEAKGGAVDAAPPVEDEAPAAGVATEAPAEAEAPAAEATEAPAAEATEAPAEASADDATADAPAQAEAEAQTDGTDAAG